MTQPPLHRRALLAAAGLGLAALALPATIGSARSPRRFEVRKTPAEWKRQLGPERYRILREAGTERAGTSPLDREKRRGTFTCAGCGLPLFASSTKFDSGTGWPSFFRALPNAVVTETDRSLLMARTEVLCRRCGGHLGHVFEDGPKPTGLRYCMNGLALRFRPA
ncbi:peptide-methionine (R)-S-oxide reductase MsrB [Sphingomonas sp.]|uniref:peptide-methionine (R)-S-oxide reductase MsrB n=1 Tax=Sphingomonas sp. TaxID=28214 RepID=UPI00286EB16B|nr:peptide-methionine (R)-S-oxide reductase MsrB [Sphingomonas sp.]